MSEPVRSAQVVSCSAAAARNVSPAAITTERPSSACWWATLPIVVVLPTPLTPTNSHTAGRAPSLPGTSRWRPRSPVDQLGLELDLEPVEQVVGVGDAVALGLGPQLAEHPLGGGTTPTSARISASSSSSQVSASTLRDRMALR